MNFAALLKQARDNVNALISQRNDIANRFLELSASASPSAEQISELRTARAGLDEQIETARARVTDLEEEQARQAELDSLQSRTSEVPQTRDVGDGTVQDRSATQVTSEPRTYREDQDPQGLQFLRDVTGSFLGNQAARERLNRHMAEERVLRGATVERGVTTGGAPGTVVPQYLVELYAPKGRPGRKFADACRKHTLPATGMDIYIPRQKAKTTVADQVSELDTVSETDYEDELISSRIRTAAGSQTISRQAVDRGIGIEDIVLGDILKAYDQNLDSQLINRATTGLLAVSNAVTYTDADPTALELYAKILQGTANVEDVLQDLDDDDLFILMRGRRYTWLQNQFTDKWPILATGGAPQLNLGTNAENPYKSGVRGHLPNGGDIITDNNLPNNLGAGTNEDVVVVVARQEAHLWEDPSAPLFIRADQPQAKKLGIDLVVWGYYAAVFNRVVDDQGSPKAVHQKITGTGLVAPVF
ncbi:hypothetical protein GCM10010401_14180 [Rarobacter faecitabidus]|uniref:HK97 family phage major capsid protein n=1 Tax=Rarobacter faecitabidus TaxID=13243 RepID=A0A542ZDW3_RARFA|nr:hypothetical protein [Rarobacter faecitabidus]TQL58535.1 hypothetical protein FB461_1950 [Rarobacter faecitabidus]